MSFTFSTTVPAAPNNPSVDQPDMLQNNVATNGILAVDHITFNASNGGTHQQMHMPAFTNPSAINGGVSDGSVIYSAAGVADTARAQIYYKNAFNLQIPLSLIKAYGCFDTAGTSLNTMNLSSSAFSGVSGYTLTMPANIVTGTNYGVLITPNQSGLNPLWGIGYAITSATQFSIGFRRVDNNAFGQPTNGFTCIVFQI